MKRYYKRLLLKEAILKDWLFWLPILIYLANLAEVIYDYFDNAPNTNVRVDIFQWFLFSLLISSPFFLFRYFSLKKYFKEEKPKIFISFATNDHTLVESIKKTLEKNSDYEYWWQNDLIAGQNYREEIERNIKNCSAILIMYSANYETSENIKEWELPFIKAEEKNRDDLIIIPCVVGEHKETIPFSDKYQVVPSRSTGFHRMASQQIKKEVKHLGEVINYQINLTETEYKNYKDNNIFTVFLIGVLVLFTGNSLDYLFGQNQIDNSIDKAINFSIELVRIDNDVLLFKEYYERGDFYDEAEIDLLQHRNMSNYINLLNDYLKKEEILGISYDWRYFLFAAYDASTMYDNYLIALEKNDLSLAEYEYGKFKDYFSNYAWELCRLVDFYTINEGYTFDASMVWYEEDYEFFCK